MTDAVSGVEGGSKVQYEALDRSEKAYWGFR